MKLFQWSLPSLMILLLCSCATPPDITSGFRESNNADVIVRFPSWKLINIVKPDTTDHGFLTLHNRTETEQILARPGIQRELAVVVCGCLVTDEQQAADEQAWVAIFQRLHFKRVVFLRAGWGPQTDGLAVLKDVGLAGNTLARQD